MSRPARGLSTAVVRNPGAGVYGAITVGAILAVESVRQETYPRTIIAVLLALLMYWLAHAYSELTGERLRAGRKLTAAALARTMLHELPLLLGAAVPVLALLIAWAVGAGLGSAVLAANWVAAGIVVVIEILAGLRAQLSGRELLVEALTGALLGLFIVVLRIVAH